jgi:hypothetical protein
VEAKKAYGYFVIGAICLYAAIHYRDTLQKILRAMMLHGKLNNFAYIGRDHDQDLVFFHAIFMIYQNADTGLP